ncbi:MAG: hypothetical protein PF638_16390 [Candidatus Delongbacteria bacterium]|jgi:hypothetical protein|nr:hypothetical protein [Candidatus Delongbacteria bacterium]
MNKKIITITIILILIVSAYFFGRFRSADVVQKMRIEKFFLESELRDTKVELDSLRLVATRGSDPLVR